MSKVYIRVAATLAVEAYGDAQQDMADVLLYLGVTGYCLLAGRQQRKGDERSRKQDGFQGVNKAGTVG